ncbi:hypothetical protein AGDE_00592 [Angomonas deanei]|uniref:Vesicle transport protein n=1 Tax=Angomonas deanei TaxID=59799 RepID=A0A7G2CBW9_9TRYP|nr:hypothetical protein AGDE_00592 [Angomonas deanei]CAD2216521.1 Got1/Sft2-like family, putative [Angomonas deanei]|eukprot:EPY43330.1 hypothetical protein AGDE_00592 [Angomonas deanei]
MTSIINIGDISSSENESLCPSLTFKQRLYGAGGCLVLGFIFSILSWVSVFLQDYVFFGVLFTIGNLISISGSLFLCGPVKQIKNMFNEGRWIASAVYIVTMILTILAAVLLKNGIAVIFCCLIQYVAMWWYFLSYIPFARDCVKNAISGALSK